MTPFLQFVFAIAIILFAAKLAGYLSIRLGQPSVLGELLIGILLGPSLVNLLNLSFLNDHVLGETITQLGDIGVMLLMFLAGLELSLTQCWRRTVDTCRGLPLNASSGEIVKVLNRLLERLGRCVLPKRKREHFEPRAVWGRPEVSPTIKGSRDAARQACDGDVEGEILVTLGFGR